MRIKNVTNDMSLVTALSLFIPSMLFILYVVLAYIGADTSNFFQWYIDEFNKENLHNRNYYRYLFVLAVMPFWVPYSFYLLINAIKRRKNEIKNMEKSRYIKAIEFLSNKINFIFFSDKYNFSCSYKNIEKLEMIINTRKNWINSYIEIILEFHISGKEVIELHNIPLFYMNNFIYSIINYAEKVNNFSYSFEGLEPPEGLEERIVNYKNIKMKPLLSIHQEIIFKWASVLLFVMGLFFLYLLRVVSAATEGLLVGVLFIIPSYIADIVLWTDRMIEKKYNVDRSEKIVNSDILVNVPFQMILAIKIIISMIVIWNINEKLF